MSEKRSSMPSAVRVVAIVVGALAALDAIAGASIFVFEPAQEGAAGLFLAAFVQAALLALCVVRGTEGGRSLAMVLGGAGLLGGLCLTALTALLVRDGKPMAPVLLLWSLATTAAQVGVLWVMRRPEVARWTSRLSDGGEPADVSPTRLGG